MDLEFNNIGSAGKVDGGCIFFTGKAGGKIVQVVISEEAVDEVTRAEDLTDQKRLDWLNGHRETIYKIARRKHALAAFDGAGRIVITTVDLVGL